MGVTNVGYGHKNYKDFYADEKTRSEAKADHTPGVKDSFKELFDEGVLDNLKVERSGTKPFRMTYGMMAYEGKLVEFAYYPFDQGGIGVHLKKDNKDYFILLDKLDDLKNIAPQNFLDNPKYRISDQPKFQKMLEKYNEDVAPLRAKFLNDIAKEMEKKENNNSSTNLGAENNAKKVAEGVDGEEKKRVKEEAHKAEGKSQKPNDVEKKNDENRAPSLSDFMNAFSKSQNSLIEGDVRKSLRSLGYRDVNDLFNFIVKDQTKLDSSLGRLIVKLIQEKNPEIILDAVLAKLLLQNKDFADRFDELVKKYGRQNVEMILKGALNGLNGEQYLEILLKGPTTEEFKDMVRAANMRLNAGIKFLEEKLAKGEKAPPETITVIYNFDEDKYEIVNPYKKIVIILKKDVEMNGFVFKAGTELIWLKGKIIEGTLAKNATKKISDSDITFLENEKIYFDENKGDVLSGVLARDVDIYGYKAKGRHKIEFYSLGHLKSLTLSDEQKLGRYTFPEGSKVVFSNKPTGNVIFSTLGKDTKFGELIFKEKTDVIFDNSGEHLVEGVLAKDSEINKIKIPVESKIHFDYDLEGHPTKKFEVLLSKDLHVFREIIFKKDTVLSWDGRYMYGTLERIATIKDNRSYDRWNSYKQDTEIVLDFYNGLKESPIVRTGTAEGVSIGMGISLADGVVYHRDKLGVLENGFHGVLAENYLNKQLGVNIPAGSFYKNFRNVNVFGLTNSFEVMKDIYFSPVKEVSAKLNFKPDGKLIEWFNRIPGLSYDPKTNKLTMGVNYYNENIRQDSDKNNNFFLSLYKELSSKRVYSYYENNYLGFFEFTSASNVIGLLEKEAKFFNISFKAGTRLEVATHEIMRGTAYTDNFLEKRFKRVGGTLSADTNVEGVQFGEGTAFGYAEIPLKDGGKKIWMKGTINKETKLGSEIFYKGDPVELSITVDNKNGKKIEILNKQKNI